ncbi:HipA N-terminal domain-containing protein [Sulfurimonas sp. HSL-1656]|uniref:HipA N-terminal domain-containing protein n=1 Tax=Thiomicrolovo subterrani TaxID=3131934 RepID=UPI0031F732E7
MQKGNVFRNGILAGEISKDSSGLYRFIYSPEYLNRDDALSISVRLPLREEAYESEYLFPFFSNMLCEGVLKELQCQKFGIDENDLFTRLLKTTSGDVIGAVTVEEVIEDGSSRHK